MFDAISGVFGFLDNWLNAEVKIMLGLLAALIPIALAARAYFRFRSQAKRFSMKDVVMMLLLIIFLLILAKAFGWLGD